MKAILKDKKIVPVNYNEYLEWLKLSGNIVALTKIDGFTIQTNLIQRKSEFDSEFFETSLINSELEILHIEKSHNYSESVDCHINLITKINSNKFNEAEENKLTELNIFSKYYGW